MIITTTPTIEGRPIARYLGVIAGEAIVGANLGCRGGGGRRPGLRGGGRQRQHADGERERHSGVVWLMELGRPEPIDMMSATGARALV